MTASKGCASSVGANDGTIHRGQDRFAVLCACCFCESRRSKAVVTSFCNKKKEHQERRPSVSCYEPGKRALLNRGKSDEEGERVEEEEEMEEVVLVVVGLTRGLYLTSCFVP